jgi:hypothetical protein
VRGFFQLSSSMRELATHGMEWGGLFVRGGGRECPDARKGPWEYAWPIFCKQWSFVVCWSIVVGCLFGFEWPGAIAVVAGMSEFVATVPLSVYRLLVPWIHCPLGARLMLGEVGGSRSFA